MKRSLREHDVATLMKTLALMMCCFATLWNASLHEFAKRICIILRERAMLHIDEGDTSLTKNHKKPMQNNKKPTFGGYE